MDTTYVEQRDKAYMLSGPRVSLDSVVYAFLSGDSAETIAQACPVLSLEQVYGAIAFYLAHREEVDRYLDMRAKDFEAQREASREADPMFYRKFADAKRHAPIARSMAVRFQADADFNQVIVSAVIRRIPPVDFQTASVTGLAGLDESDSLSTNLMS